jgi:DNA-binding transcriptional MerR regulator
MPGIAANRYTARELAQLGGITERTVRYYVQDRLIEPPDGRGRGAHFDDRHLTQLRRVRLLQEAGLENAAIRQYGEDLESALAKRGIRLKDAERSWANFTLEATQAYRNLARPKLQVTDTSTLTRVGIAPGIDLFIAGTRRLPPPARLAEVVRFVRSAFSIEDK